MKNEIKAVFVHPELLNVDLPKIAQTMTLDQFREFFECYNKAVKQAMKEPFAQGTELEYKLLGWNRRDYFSVKKPSPGVHPDKRFVYKFNRDNDSFYKLATGNRNPKGVGGTSIYKVAELRDKTKWQLEE